MILVKCQNCEVVIQVPDQYAGTSGQCRNCGGIILVPEASAPPSAKTKPRVRNPRTKVRLVMFVAGLSALLILLAGLSFWRGSDGTPFGLVLFVFNFAVGVAAGSAFFVELHTPDILSERLRIPLTRLLAAAILIPSSVIAFFFAWITYAP